MSGTHRRPRGVRPTDFATDPYAVLRVDREAGEAAIRQAYLEGVRGHPPERDPEGFKRVRQAYERLATADARAAALVEVPEPPPADGLSVETELHPNGRAGERKPALAGIPLAFLLSLDPFSDLIPSDVSEDTDDA